MIKLNHIFAIALAFSCLTATVRAADDLLADGHPSRYVVQKGDTLWDISAMFLRDPWRWTDIWYVNPQVANPHLIYPGDELELTYVNGKPQLRRVGGDIKLSPEVRSTPWDGAIPTIPIDAIAPFLKHIYVTTKEEMESAPYIVSFGVEHLIGGEGQSAYVRSVDDTDTEKFVIIRPGDAYKDADTGEVIGYEALYVGSANLQKPGDPATVFINQSEQEINVGDRLAPAVDPEAMLNFTPKPPEQDVYGSIISVINGVTQIGQYNVVVIDRGTADGLEPGSVLQIDVRGETIPDPVSKDRRDTVTLPDEKAGLLMVFRSFDRVSFGLVMHATRAMHVLDRVHNP